MTGASLYPLCFINLQWLRPLQQEIYIEHVEGAPLIYDTVISCFFHSQTSYIDHWHGHWSEAQLVYLFVLYFMRDEAGGEGKFPIWSPMSTFDSQ